MYNPSREQQLIDEEMKKEMDNEILDIHAKEQDGWFFFRGIRRIIQ